MKIKDLPRVDRPREKLLKYGSDKLSTTELLAILLRTGIKGKNVVELSNQILKLFGTESLQAITITNLRKIKGLGSVKATEIIAAIALGKRLIIEKTPMKAINPESVFEALSDIRKLKKEHFIAFYLDTKNVEIARETISIGTLNASLVHPREVFEPAIRLSAASVIIAHNHPSGDVTPSHEDMQITKKLADAGNLLDIHILDHIIVSSHAFLSFKEKGFV